MIRVALLFVALSVAAQGAVDVDRVARALAVVEDSAGRVGAAGERGDLQFLPRVWAMYSKRPLSWASGSAPEMHVEQERVGRAHVVWILARLGRLGLSESAWAVGLVHNAGYGRVRDRRVLPRHRDFAERVANVYGELSKPQGYGGRKE